MITATANTWWVRLYAAGPIEVAKQTIRRFCLDVGLCVNIYPNTYIYTGGEETGYVVELVNYPRFPVEPTVLEDTAKRLAAQLLNDTFQHSIMWMDPSTTTWISKRKENSTSNAPTEIKQAEQLPAAEFARIVDVVNGWLDDAPATHRDEFISTEKANLVQYHHSLGRDIRNEFGLWQYSWTPQVEDGVDMSPDHPDAVSMRVIEAVWKKHQQ